MNLTAHYTAGTKTRPATVVIARGPAPTFDARVAEITVSGKREANRVAAEYGATPWNW